MDVEEVLEEFRGKSFFDDLDQCQTERLRQLVAEMDSLMQSKEAVQ